MKALPPGFEFDGFDVALEPFIHAAGIWPFHMIRISGPFLRLDEDMQKALFWHEVAHCRLFHREKRILLALPLLLVGALRRFAHAQELEADRYCVDHGYGRPLLRFLTWARSGQPATPAEGDYWHPDLGERIEALAAYMRGER
jgi:hypothetical protein